MGSRPFASPTIVRRVFHPRTTRFRCLEAQLNFLVSKVHIDGPGYGSQVRVALAYVTFIFCVVVIADAIFLETTACSLGLPALFVAVAVALLTGLTGDHC